MSFNFSVLHVDIHAWLSLHHRHTLIGKCFGKEKGLLCWSPDSLFFLLCLWGFAIAVTVVVVAQSLYDMLGRTQVSCPLQAKFILACFHWLLLFFILSRLTFRSKHEHKPREIGVENLQKGYHLWKRKLYAFS